MHIADLRVEYQKNPIGMDVLRPRFSWKLETENQNTMQEGYQIQVVSKEKMIWDSGCRKSEQSVLVEYDGLPLQALIFRQNGLHIRLQKRKLRARYL